MSASQTATIVLLHAFSGQYNGLWLVDGWVPPLFDIDEFLDIDRRERKADQTTRTGKSTSVAAFVRLAGAEKKNAASSHEN